MRKTVNLNRVFSRTRVENGRSLEDLGNTGDFGEFAECGSYQFGIFNSFSVTGIFTGLKRKAPPWSPDALLTVPSMS